MTDAFLRIENLTKNFGSFTALRDISLSVLEGEFVCFLGPSGCGKTTLLRAIAGLDIQTQGRIEQAGIDISILPPAERDFGIVFQSYALFPNLTVEKNVAYGLESRRAARSEVIGRVKELLALVDLADQGKKYPSQLSGGQQQRVALARALATSPGLLLLDEPLSALAFKIMSDPHLGKLTFVRVYSGRLRSGTSVLNSVKGKKERIGKIYRMHANKRTEIDSAGAGDIVAVMGLKQTTTGETLCDESAQLILESMDFPAPVIEVAIEPRSKGDQEKLGVAIQRLAEEDPSFRVHSDEETGQTIIGGMGELHLEVLVDRMKREFRVEANVGKPQVAYRETIRKAVDPVSAPIGSVATGPPADADDSDLDSVDRQYVPSEVGARETRTGEGSGEL